MYHKSVLFLLAAIVPFTRADDGQETGWGCGTYTAYNGICYSIKSHDTFHGAQETCVKEGGNLLSIHDKETNEFFYKLVKETVEPGTFLWIGLRHDPPKTLPYRTDGFTWTDETPFNFKYFSVYPMDDPVCYAISMLTPWKWTAMPDCEYTNKFICQRQKKTGMQANRQNPSAPDPNYGCDNYSEYNGMCYSIKTNNETFLSAHGTCVEEGGHLLSIHDMQTNQYFYNLLVQTGIKTYFWIGLQFYGGVQTYNWTDSTPFNLMNVPDGVAWESGSDCFALSNVRLSSPSKWVNKNCENNALPFICQRQRTKIPTTTTTTTTATTPETKLGCGQIHYSSEGKITSPNFPYSFQAASCNYQIDMSNIGSTHAHAVNVKIPAIHALGHWIISLYEGSNVDPSLLIATINSSDPPAEQYFSSRKPQMLIQFASAASGVGQPFFISYNESHFPQFSTGMLPALTLQPRKCDDCDYN